MARLETFDGGWLELTPVGYQFPGPNWNCDDANWLNVEFAAEFGDQLTVSRRSSPCFLTWELVSFVGAGRELVLGSLAAAQLEGLEPCLAIDVTSFAGQLRARVAVALEFAPLTREPFDKPFEATISITHNAFRHFIESLAIEMEPFPARE